MKTASEMKMPNKLIKRFFTVCIEGNIGSGKTTFLNNFKQIKNTLVLQEPVELWRNLKGDNLLDLMYKQPEKYACLFQSYVQLTMLQRHTIKTNESYKIMERSVYSARCFIENMKRTKLIQPVEINVLEQWHNWCIANCNIQTDLLVYIRTTPEIVYERIKSRARTEENCISIQYLKQIHNIHEDWLLHKKLFLVPAPVIVIDGDQSIADMYIQFEQCKNKIFSKNSPKDLCQSIGLLKDKSKIKTSLSD